MQIKNELIKIKKDYKIEIIIHSVCLLFILIAIILLAAISTNSFNFGEFLLPISVLVYIISGIVFSWKNLFKIINLVVKINYLSEKQKKKLLIWGIVACVWFFLCIGSYIVTKNLLKEVEKVNINNNTEIPTV